MNNQSLLINTETTEIIVFNEGLPGFETHHKFVLTSNEEEAPFIWLHSSINQNMSFITIDPFHIIPNYRPDIHEDDILKLKIKNEEDIALLIIINIKNNKKKEVTANFISPILINWKERLGKQVILKNHQDYSLRHPVS
jgi:flagellar assembly factor FliW